MFTSHYTLNFINNNNNNKINKKKKNTQTKRTSSVFVPMTANTKKKKKKRHFNGKITVLNISHCEESCSQPQRHFRNKFHQALSICNNLWGWMGNIID